MGFAKCAEKLGTSKTALTNWVKLENKNGTIVTRGTGNYASDEAKELAKVKRKLRDTQDALEILKKTIGILGNR